MNRLIVLMLCVIYTLLFPKVSFSQWSTNTALNTPVCTEMNNQKDLSISSDSKGGAIIVWTDKRNDNLRADIYAQRLNSFGYPMWQSQGVGVCVTSADKANPSSVEDGNSGIIIAWDDSLNNDRDIYAQKLDSSGNPKWNLNGVPVVVKLNKQKDVKIISDGAGGAIAVWEDSLNGYWDIFAQRISSNGNLLWDSLTTGTPICTALFNQKNPRLTTDGLGGAYIVWQDKRNDIDFDIYAQHINSTGNISWGANGVIICSAVEKQIDPKIVSDGLGGAIVVWQDKRNGLNNDIYAQRLNSTGPQWGISGISVCTADSSQTAIDITSEGINGAIVTWRDKRNGLYHDIYAQKINLNGTVAWQTDGVPITTAALTQTEPNVCGDGNGGAIIVWQDSTYLNWDIKSQRINMNGIVQWNQDGNFVSNANNVQTSPKNISDGKGGSIYAWNDTRNNTDDDIYVQHLSALGMEDLASENVLKPDIRICPNPVNDNAILHVDNIDLRHDKYMGIIYDVCGREVMFIEIYNNEQKIYFAELSEGIYTLRVMKIGVNVTTEKFIIEK